MLKEPPKPIIIQTPEEGVVSLVTFHTGQEDERKAATTLLLTVFDFDEKGELIRKDLSYTELPLKDLPESLQEILKEDFSSADIQDDSLIIMRFFKDQGNGEWSPIFLHDEGIDE